MLYTAVFVATALACSEKQCNLRLYEHARAKGSYRDFGNGNHGSLGWLNNRASSIQLTSGCTAELYTGPNFTGRKQIWRSQNAGSVIYDLGSRASSPGFEDNIESVKVFPGGRRRLAGPGFFDEFQARDPLCEWILQDGLDNDWTFGNSQEEKNEEIERLLRECDLEFADDEADLAQCKFYVYAIAAYYDDAELVRDLQFNPEEETPDSEYMLCGHVATKINNAIAEGKISGVKLVEGEDGEDVFELEAADFENHPVFVKDGNDVIATVLSVGAMISMVVANTLVKVCRDFDAVDYHWLLA